MAQGGQIFGTGVLVLGQKLAQAEGIGKQGARLEAGDARGPDDGSALRIKRFAGAKSGWSYSAGFLGGIIRNSTSVCFPVLTSTLCFQPLQAPLE